MNLKKLAGGAVIVAGLLSVCMLFAVAFSPTIGAQSASQVFTRPLLKGVMRLAESAGIRPGTANTGYFGTSTYPLGDIYVDSLRTGVVRLGASDTTGGPSGAVILSVHNVSGSGISAASAVVWDAGPVVAVVGDAVTKSASLTITGDLTTETANGGKFSLRATISGTSGNYDTITVVGLDAYGTSQTVSLSITGEAAGQAAATLVRTNTLNSSDSETLYWTDIISVSATSAQCPVSDNITLTAYGYATVKESDGNNTDFAGVTVDSIPDNNIGPICVYGPVLATVDANSNDAGPGVMLEVTSSGDLVTDTAATVGKTVGRAMEYSNLANYAIRVFLGL